MSLLPVALFLGVVVGIVAAFLAVQGLIHVRKGWRGCKLERHEDVGGLIACLQETAGTCEVFGLGDANAGIAAWFLVVFVAAGLSWVLVFFNRGWVLKKWVG